MTTRGKSLAYKPGAGAKRDYWAIKVWLDTNNLTLKEIAKKESIHVGLVSATIRGTRNTRRVIKRLLDMGCPPEIISVPDDMNIGQASHVN